MTKKVIGIDFDNTIILYDELVFKVALEMSLIPSTLPHNKTVIRDHLRTLEDGDEKWQRVQGQIYGKRILEAKPASGFNEFVIKARKNGYMLYIVSHKTQFGHFDESKADLRVAARTWMRAKNFFSPSGLKFEDKDVHFASTREDKINLINKLSCGIFIDDLPEVLMEPTFPASCSKILFGTSYDKLASNILPCSNWPAVLKTHLFTSWKD